MVEQEQAWVECPTDRSRIDYVCKVNLRTSYNYAPLHYNPNPLTILDKKDYGDDTYGMRVDNESVFIVARWKGQIERSPVFPEIEEGVFILVSERNKDRAIRNLENYLNGKPFE